MVEATGICLNGRMSKCRQLPYSFQPPFADVSRVNPRKHAVSAKLVNKTKNNGQSIDYPLFLVEATGLEPTTFWSLTKRATKLRYASIFFMPNALPRNSINHYTHLIALSQAFFRCFLKFFQKIGINF